MGHQTVHDAKPAFPMPSGSRIDGCVSMASLHQQNRNSPRLVAATLMLSLHACSWGAEGASTEYVGGFTGFAAGYVPTDPGTYLANYLYHYNGSTAAVAVNGKVALNVGTSVYFEIPGVTYIAKLTLFGGNYGFGIAVPVGYVNVDVGASGSTPPVSGKACGATQTGNGRADITATRRRERHRAPHSSIG
jgi:hypothetical protein